jgi:GT2 family glycosyltransferase
MIGVVIPFHSQHEALSKAIRSVGASPVVVVDDSPEGGLVIDGVTVLRTLGEQGFASAANMGLAHWEAQAVERVLLLNDDAALRPGAMDALRAAWTEKDGALAPVVFEPDGPIYGIDIGPLGRVRLRSSPGNVGALSGAAMLLRSRERFDPGFIHGFEDIELCARLRSKGLQIRVIPGAECDHAAGLTVSRKSRIAQRRAMAGHLRWVGGGLPGALAIGMGLAQIVRERGPAERVLGVLEGVVDHVIAVVGWPAQR